MKSGAARVFPRVCKPRGSTRRAEAVFFGLSPWQHHLELWSDQMHETEEGGHGAAEVDRRSFLGLFAMAISGLVALCGGVVALVYAAAPALRRSESANDGAWSAIPVDSVTEPTRKSVAVVSDAGWAKTQAAGAVFLDRGGDGSLVAFSARCPHEGCQIEWNGGADKFVCPCHASSWTRKGERLGGPTKRGMDPLDVRKAPDGGVEVKYVTYALDSSERIQVG